MATNYIIEKVTDSNGGSDRIASTFYGTCSTAAGTAQKAVTISDSCTFNDNYLITGVTVHVKFTYSNTNATPTLKVGSATAKQIMAYGTTKSGTTETTSWYAGAVVSFTYDGTYWVQNDYKLDTNTTYESKAAASGGTDVSLCTTGEKYTWNNKGSGTVTSVTIKATSPIAVDSTSAITTSGTRTLSHANSGVTAGTYKSVTVNATGHVTAGTNPTTLSGYGITDALDTSTKYASSNSSGGNTLGIIRCETASTSTATAFVVTVDGITALSHGLTLLIKNTVISSAQGCTINLNGLGAKRIWRSQGNAYVTTDWELNQTFLFIYDANNTRWEMQQGYVDGNTDTRIRVYRQTSGYNSDYPILVSRTLASSIGTVGTDGSNSLVYGVINNDSSKIPTINPNTGLVKVPSLSGDISNGTIDANGFQHHAYFSDPTIKTVLLDYENEIYSGTWTKFNTGAEISLANVYVTGLAYSSKYVEGSIYLSEKVDSAVTFSNCTLSGGKVAMYGANGQIYASSATYPSYSITGVRDAGVITVKFTLSSNFSTNNNNKPAIIWFDSGAKLTLH